MRVVKKKRWPGNRTYLSSRRMHLSMLIGHIRNMSEEEAVAELRRLGWPAYVEGAGRRTWIKIGKIIVWDSLLSPWARKYQV